MQIIDQFNKPNNIYIPLYVGNKLKSWPLYLFVSISVFLWVAMTLYQDKIDEFCLNKFEELEPLYVSIYVCIKNFLHGFCLFLILVLLAHLSDIENRFGLDSTQVKSLLDNCRPGLYILGTSNSRVSFITRIEVCLVFVLICLLVIYVQSFG